MHWNVLEKLMLYMVLTNIVKKSKTYPVVPHVEEDDFKIGYGYENYDELKNISNYVPIFFVQFPQTDVPYYETQKVHKRTTARKNAVNSNPGTLKKQFLPYNNNYSAPGKNKFENTPKKNLTNPLVNNIENIDQYVDDIINNLHITRDPPRNDAGVEQLVNIINRSPENYYESKYETNLERAEPTESYNFHIPFGNIEIVYSKRDAIENDIYNNTGDDASTNNAKKKRTLLLDDFNTGEDENDERCPSTNFADTENTQETFGKILNLGEDRQFYGITTQTVLEESENQIASDEMVQNAIPKSKKSDVPRGIGDVNFGGISGFEVGNNDVDVGKSLNSKYYIFLTPETPNDNQENASLPGNLGADNSTNIENNAPQLDILPYLSHDDNATSTEGGEMQNQNMVFFLNSENTTEESSTDTESNTMVVYKLPKKNEEEEEGNKNLSNNELEKILLTALAVNKLNETSPDEKNDGGLEVTKCDSSALATLPASQQMQRSYTLDKISMDSIIHRQIRSTDKIDAMCQDIEALVTQLPPEEYNVDNSVAMDEAIDLNLQDNSYTIGFISGQSKSMDTEQPEQETASEFEFESYEDSEETTPNHELVNADVDAPIWETVYLKNKKIKSNDSPEEVPSRNAVRFGNTRIPEIFRNENDEIENNYAQKQLNHPQFLRDAPRGEASSSNTTPPEGNQLLDEFPLDKTTPETIEPTTNQLLNFESNSRSIRGMIERSVNLEGQEQQTYAYPKFKVKLFPNGVNYVFKSSFKPINVNELLHFEVTTASEVFQTSGDINALGKLFKTTSASSINKAIDRLIESCLQTTTVTTAGPNYTTDNHHGSVLKNQNLVFGFANQTKNHEKITNTSNYVPQKLNNNNKAYLSSTITNQPGTAQTLLGNSKANLGELVKNKLRGINNISNPTCLNKNNEIYTVTTFVHWEKIPTKITTTTTSTTTTTTPFDGNNLNYIPVVTIELTIDSINKLIKSCGKGGVEQTTKGDQNCTTLKPINTTTENTNNADSDKILKALNFLKVITTTNVPPFKNNEENSEIIRSNLCMYDKVVSDLVALENITTTAAPKTTKTVVETENNYEDADILKTLHILQAVTTTVTTASTASFSYDQSKNLSDSLLKIIFDENDEKDTPVPHMQWNIFFEKEKVTTQTPPISTTEKQPDTNVLKLIKTLEQRNANTGGNLQNALTEKAVSSSSQVTQNLITTEAPKNVNTANYLRQVLQKIVSGERDEDDEISQRDLEKTPQLGGVNIIREKTGMVRNFAYDKRSLLRKKSRNRNRLWRKVFRKSPNRPGKLIFLNSRPYL